MTFNLNNVFERFDIKSTVKMLLNKFFDLKLINKTEIQILLKEWQKDKGDIMSLITSFGFLHEDEIEKIILDEFQIPKAIFEKISISDSIMQSLSLEVCLAQGFLPFLEKDKELCVAVVDFLAKTEEEILEYISLDSDLQGMTIKKFYIKESDLKIKINNLFEKQNRIESLVNYLNGTVFEIDAKIKNELSTVKDPIIDFTESLLGEAISIKATEISAELNNIFLTIRLKSEGNFKTTYRFFNAVGVRILNRLKILSGIGIAENNAKKEGSFTFSGFEFNVFSSSIAFGEALHINLIQRFKRALSLEELGISKVSLTKMIKVLEKTSGGIWICGAESSGITTTLYAILDHIASKTKKVCIVDEKLEFTSPFAMQFNSNIFSALKHEPSVLAVNDIKNDEEIINLMNANIEGMKTVASIKAIDFFNLYTKFINKKIEKSLVSASIKCVISQKFIKTLCENCKVEIPLKMEELSALKIAKTDVKAIYKHSSCEKCNYTGYLGKVPIFEIVIFDVEIEDALNQSMPKKEVQDTIKRKGFTSLFEEARLKVLQGITDIEEISLIH